MGVVRPFNMRYYGLIDRRETTLFNGGGKMSGTERQRVVCDTHACMPSACYKNNFCPCSIGRLRVYHDDVHRPLTTALTYHQSLSRTVGRLHTFCAPKRFNGNWRRDMDSPHIIYIRFHMVHCLRSLWAERNELGLCVVVVVVIVTNTHSRSRCRFHSMRPPHLPHLPTEMYTSHQPKKTHTHTEHTNTTNTEYVIFISRNNQNSENRRTVHKMY